MLILLILAAVLCYIFGMGVPAVIAYIMVSIFVAPALVEFGVPLLAAHLFIFYMALTAFITPPVAVSAFVAAGIAGANSMRVALNSIKLAVIIYIVPFMFIYDQALIFQGSPFAIASAMVTGIIGATLVAWAIGGYHVLGKANWIHRILFAASGVLLIFPGWSTNFIGIAVGGMTLAWSAGKLPRIGSLGRSDKP